jgi:hypothetical protein
MTEVWRGVELSPLWSSAADDVWAVGAKLVAGLVLASRLIHWNGTQLEEVDIRPSIDRSKSGVISMTGTAKGGDLWLVLTGMNENSNSERQFGQLARLTRTGQLTQVEVFEPWQ